MIDFFVYSRDGTDTAALRDDLIEQHWAYMDRFAGSMIARGPTLTGDREVATGSLHVLGLPSADAARTFVELEPNNRAGVYVEHAIWRFDNLLGRTMWEFGGDIGVGEPRFLVIARASEAQGRPPLPLADLPRALRERLILYGTLATPDGDSIVGVALALAAASREHVEALLRDAESGLDAFPDRDVHDWEFGGRR